MLDKFWESVGGKLGDRWAASATTALIYVLLGVIAWTYAGSGWSRPASVVDWVEKQSRAGQFLVLAGALASVVALIALVQHLTLPVLRLLEGYWTSRLEWLGGRCRQRLIDKRNTDVAAWQALLVELGQRQPTATELARQSSLERRIHNTPLVDAHVLPTRTGNILRAGETRPLARFGLDAVAVWPRLWLVMPDTARTELANARAALDTAVTLVIYAVALLAFIPFTWWALPVGLVAAVTAGRYVVRSRAEVYADLITAAVELYRTNLYAQLHWPLPANPRDEVRSGQELMTYLVRGSDQTYPRFTEPKAAK